VDNLKRLAGRDDLGYNPTGLSGKDGTSVSARSYQSMAQADGHHAV
jgi:hypothetical protein